MIGNLLGWQIHFQQGKQTQFIRSYVGIFSFYIAIKILVNLLKIFTEIFPVVVVLKVKIYGSNKLSLPFGARFRLF